MFSSVLIYLYRLSKEVKGHESAIVGVKSVARCDLVSATSDGVLLRWDVRQFTAHRVDSGRSLLHLDCHPEADLFASATTEQAVRLYHGDRSIGCIKNREGFLGQRIAPVTGLTFHPRKLILSIAGTDGSSLLYSWPHL